MTYFVKKLKILASLCKDTQCNIIWQYGTNPDINMGLVNKFCNTHIADIKKWEGFICLISSCGIIVKIYVGRKHDAKQ